MGVTSFNSFDERTHVGRQNMLWEQTNMYKRIHAVKSTVDTKLVRPHVRPKSAVGTQRQRAEIDHFREVREAARRINDLHLKKRSGLTTFTSPPRSMEFSKRLSENRAAARSSDPSHLFHAKQVANMRRRIAEQGTLVERKKNVYDTNVHPVLIRQKTAKTQKTPPWGFGSGRLSSAAASRPAAAKETSRPATARTSARNAPGSDRNTSAPVPGSGYWTSPREVPGVSHMRPARKPAREHPAYQTLRKKLLHEIVAKDASEEDMGGIFAEAIREQSGSQHKHVLKAVIADLKIELELQPEA